MPPLEPAIRSTTHFFSVDVEEYFHANALESVISREEWPRWPMRLDRTLPPLLELMERYDARGTFFVLGWVAERAPHIVRSIVAAGHEVASHGHWHRRIPTLTPSEFREDLRRSKSILEDVSGKPVRGFRAPSFSLLPGLEWVLDVLIDEGFSYDSSIFPIRRRGYGYPGAIRVPHVIARGSRRIAEFPMATTTVAGFVVPAAGGGYLRHFPFALIRRAFVEASVKSVPATFYIHPWDMDPGQPRVAVSALTRLRHYRGLSRVFRRLEELLNTFRFTSMGASVDALLATERGVSLAS